MYGASVCHRGVTQEMKNAETRIYRPSGMCHCVSLSECLGFNYCVDTDAQSGRFTGQHLKLLAEGKLGGKG